ncbi:sodium- and chloride-dependent creatine transporter 1-like [Tigriopus californicus]|nr:sodium- and chloride-dependent creatine transporter 1-like [Tigriopus californicus]
MTNKETGIHQENGTHLIPDAMVPPNKETPPATENLRITPERDVWGNGMEFVLACVGFAVGLGNIWRFPYLCYKNGGGAFLIPYFVYAIGGGIPMMFLEVGLGQFMSQGNISIWNICPIFKGIGIGSTVMTAMANIYYIVVFCWALHYFFACFGSSLPWASCGNPWNTVHCLDIGSNRSEIADKVTDPAVEYWENRVLGVTNGLEEVGGLQWELVGTLFLAWIMVYCCIFKGVRSTGKVVYFTTTFPYLMLIVLFIRGVTLPGAMDGLIFYLKPDFTKLLQSQVWIDAGTQVFFSYCVAIGGLVALGSYNEYHTDYVRDCTIIAIINSSTSLFGGLVIFSVLGYMSFVSGIPVNEVAESGPGLIFIVYPKAVSLMPGAHIWAILFFLMIVIVGFNSQFVACEGVVTAIMDQFSEHFNFRYAREITAGLYSLVSFLLGLSMVTKGGIYVFQIFDYYAASGMVLLFFILCECGAISWFYGVTRWSNNVEEMIGRPVNLWIKFCWTFFTPFLSMGLFIFAIIQYTPLSYNKTYVYPLWGQLIGAALGIASTICIPLYIIFALITAPQENIILKIQGLTKPQMETTLYHRSQQQPRDLKESKSPMNV